MPLIETKGAASAQGFGEFLQQSAPIYIENVFSTYLYTGNGSTQTITNGIDLSGKGGLVWVKERNNSYGHVLVDTSRGINQVLRSNDTAAQTTYGSTVSAFNSNGFSLGSSAQVNDSFAGYQLYASWTFRKQPKFFDIVTYTGNGTGDRTISHNLGSVPGCIIVKRYDTAEVWQVFHRSINAGRYGFIRLDSINAAITSTAYDWNPTSTTFVADNDLNLNYLNGTYVAYLFAHNAGGFGLTSSDNVISCGSYTGNGVSTGVGQGFQVTLGYEPQFVMIKRATGGSGSWWIGDNMRGLFGNGTNAQAFQADTSAAEQTYGVATPNATGFTIDQSDSGVNASGSTYIYIAIRRGPMKVPTSGTSVFSPVAYNGTGTTTIQTLTTNFPVDAFIQTSRQDSTTDRRMGNRLVGQEKYVLTDLSAAEQTILSGNGVNNTVGFASNTGIGVQGDWNNPSSPGYSPYILEAFRRAPKFFDVVCYTGTGAASQSYNHNLGVAPELMLVKVRSSSGSWAVYSSALGASTVLTLNATDAAFTSGSVFSAYWGSAAPTSSVFSVGSIGNTGGSGSTYVAYLFATCAGVSKVGSYTGTGALQTVNCGFTGGARFVLIKRTDSTGDWYVYDSARGISSGNDPYLFLNTTAAETTGTNYVDTTSVGFQVTAAAPAGLNANGGTYIFLAIA